MGGGGFICQIESLASGLSGLRGKWSRASNWLPAGRKASHKPVPSRLPPLQAPPLPCSGPWCVGKGWPTYSNWAIFETCGVEPLRHQLNRRFLSCLLFCLLRHSFPALSSTRAAGFGAVETGQRQRSRSTVLDVISTRSFVLNVIKNNVRSTGTVYYR